MRRIVLSLAAALIVAGATSFMIVPAATQRAETANGVFLIPASDGYGVAECIAENRECGAIVAKAWCESKGFLRAESFGVASPADFTGSVNNRSTPARQTEPPLMIACAR
jgi:hypothetical protein